MEKKRYYIVYQITNKVNKNVYIGCHVTENINDKYFGSGTNIKKAIKEFGKENFEKILLYNFDDEVEMLNKERELVNDEFIKRGDTYNIILGGGVYNTINTITVKDKYGNVLQIHKTDPRYLSGELVGSTTGKVVAKDSSGIIYYISINDPRYLSGELVHSLTGIITVKDRKNNIYSVSKNDPRYLSGELIGLSSGMISVKDLSGNTYQVSKEDERYLSGELSPIWFGKKHKEESKKKIGEKNSILQKGEKNSNYGKCWIYNIKLKENKSIKKEEINKWIENGWYKGRKQKM